MLCGRKKNWLLCGSGAERFAASAGIPMREMLTEEARRKWLEAKETAEEGHDTVCVIARDDSGRMIVGTSTSGLFMKEPGRVGDTPIVGSGFYCDANIGGAAATGLGEEIMRGCLSYAAVSYMCQGKDAQSAAQLAVSMFRNRLAGMGESPEGISLITMDASGNTGAASTLESFPFSVGDALYEATYRKGKVTILRRDPEEIPFG
jgi:isoaspartyl peptidase/L-asparaginase-like protein (Ntn-hydrolase superfamily)